MPLFTSDTINRLFNQAEQNISVDKPFLVDRTELNIVAGTSNYTLPNYVTGIRRVTWLGFGLDPLPQRNQREVFQSASQQGKPFWYIFDNLNQNQIKLFPCPATNVVTGTDPWQADIPNCVIVEYYRVTDNSSFIVPSYARRQLLKQYVARQLYALEGKGQNKKLSAYFDKKWQMFKEAFIEHLDYMHTSARKFVCNEIVQANYFPGSPILPIDKFGTGVDDGY